jgi:hypothetical protein
MSHPRTECPTFYKKLRYVFLFDLVCSAITAVRLNMDMLSCHGLGCFFVRVASAFLSFFFSIEG